MRFLQKINMSTCLITLFLLGFLLTACGATLPPVSVPTPRVTDPQTPVRPGEQVSVIIEISSPAPVSYQWNTNRGEIIEGETTSAIIWQAPREPGLYNIGVKVTINGVVHDRAVAIRVEAETTVVDKPTDTPIPKSTDTPTTTPIPTDTLTAVPAHTHTPTLTDTLIPSLNPTFTSTPTPILLSSVTPTLAPSPPEETSNIIELNPAVFERQDTDGDGINDEFMRFTTSERPDLPLPVLDGINLSDYDLEFAFQGADGREVKIWYKSRPDWNNVVSAPYTINSGQPIRYDLFNHGRSQDDPGFDLAHIWAIGARVSGGVEGVQLSSARLIKRNTTQKPCSEARITSPQGIKDESQAANYTVSNPVTISWEPASCNLVVQYYQLGRCYTVDSRECTPEQPAVASGAEVTIPPGMTQIKIWHAGQETDNTWFLVE